MIEVSSEYACLVHAGSTVVNVRHPVGTSCLSIYLNHSVWNSWLSLLIGFCWYWHSKVELFIFLRSLSKLSLSNRLVCNTSHFRRVNTQSSTVIISSFSAIAGRESTVQSSPVLFFILSMRCPHRSSSCVLCIIIMIHPFNGLLRRLGTVFSNQLFIPVRIISLSASSGLSGSSIMKQLKPRPVNPQPEPVA